MRRYNADGCRREGFTVGTRHDLHDRGHPPAGACALGRRTFVGYLAGLLACPSASVAVSPQAYPSEVAGIRLPATPLCAKAHELCRSAAPAFLLNHSLRTYVFGALYAAHEGQRFDAESAFVAAVLHDLGLLSQFATPHTSFEVDGANRAESLVRDSAHPPGEANTVWNAIVMHDMRFAIARHESPEATLLAAGAGADVAGPEEDVISRTTVSTVVATLPRLQFKQRFIALLTDHCVRKPGAQNGTWLEGFCRAHSTVAASATEQAILAAPFDE
jgi:HD domain